MPHAAPKTFEVRERFFCNNFCTLLADIAGVAVCRVAFSEAECSTCCSPTRVFSGEQISQIREMPQGAADIVTTLVPVAKTKDIVNRLKDREDTDDKVLKLCSSSVAPAWP